MKKIILAWTVLSVLFSVSCQKFDNEKPLTFDVHLESTTFKVGDPVTFRFTGGDAHQISFYSGEVGNDYDYRDKSRVDEIKRVYFSFLTHNTIVGQEVYPDLLVSTDFNGEYDYESVNNATWTSVAHLYKWGPNKPYSSSEFTASGNAEITEYIDQGKPFYIAFRVQADPKPTGTVSRSWRTRTHTLIVETFGGNFIHMADYKGMDWQLVDKYVAGGDIATYTTTQVASTILLLGNHRNTSQWYREAGDVWGISKKFQSGEVSLGSSKSISLKQYVELPLESYTHYYEFPGTYKVVFLASNATVSSTTQVVKELEITITP